MIAYLNTYKEQIESALNTYIPFNEHLPHHTLFAAARYSLFPPGKRLRPLLALASADTFSIPIEHALAPACALECIHTYSLIHDDLPSMDNDDMRRGRPSLHKVYSEGHAILTGDFLLTKAFEILAKAPHISAPIRLEMIKRLTELSGAEGMIAGQVVDISMDCSSAHTLSFTHLHKTAALICASLEFGGLLARASSLDMILLRKTGIYLGLGFQYIDDVLDTDEKPHRNIAHFLGYNGATQEAQMLFAAAARACHCLSHPPSALLLALLEQMEKEAAVLSEKIEVPIHTQSKPSIG